MSSKWHNACMPIFTIHIPEIQGNSVRFRYSYERFSFEETHTFTFPLQSYASVYALAIVTSISYFKLHLAPQIHVEWNISASEKKFWEWIFRNGFSELVYQNKLDWNVVDRITLSCENIEALTISQSKLFSEKAIVGIGGGKDSSVAVELLKKMNIGVCGFATKTRATSLLNENTHSLEIPLIEINRITDPQLLTLRNNVFLGHVPISLIYAFTGIVIAEHQQAQYVIVANETSADEANTIWNARSVNHQWSKTIECEKKVQDFVLEILNPKITYFSLLRPFGALRITQLFTEICKNSFTHFSSCNKNFTIEKKMESSWCGTCAKCVGTWILLATFLDHDVLRSIFKKDIYANSSLFPILKELLGLLPIKPFDCVATRGEMCLALLQSQETYIRTPLLEGLTPTDWTYIQDTGTKSIHFLTGTFPHHIPDSLAANLFNITDARI